MVSCTHYTISSVYLLLKFPESKVTGHYYNGSNNINIRQVYTKDRGSLLSLLKKGRHVIDRVVKGDTFNLFFSVKRGIPV